METKEMRLHGLFAGLLIVFLAVLAVALAFCPRTLTMNQGQNEDTIQVTGSYAMDAMPDEAYVYVRIETLDADPKAAQDKNKETANNVIDALKKLGVKKEDIETTQYNLEEQREWVKDTYKLLGYKQINVFKVTTKDLESTGNIIDTAVDAGANKIDSVSFGLSKEGKSKINAEVLVNAAQNARSKAEALADSLDAKLDDVSTISESNIDYGDNYYPRYAMDSEKAMGGAPTPISPTQVTVSATVNVVFGIE